MKTEELLEFFIEKLYITKEEFFESRKRGGVSYRVLFTYFYMKHSGESNYGVHKTLSKFFKRVHSTVIYYKENHEGLLKTDKLYRRSFTTINQYFNNGNHPFTTTDRETKES